MGGTWHMKAVGKLISSGTEIDITELEGRAKPTTDLEGLALNFILVMYLCSMYCMVLITIIHFG